MTGYVDGSMLVAHSVQWMKSPIVPPAPEGIVLSIRAEEFRSRCLVMYVSSSFSSS